MKKMKKMNNKGFSLVELIIVIVIMAILAGALAPALLRYIEKTRVSNDKTTAANLKTAVETALANEEVMDAIASTTGADGSVTARTYLEFTITTDSNGATYPAACPTELKDEIVQTLASSKMKIKSKKDLKKEFVVAIAFGEAGEADVVEVYLHETSGAFVDTQGVKVSTVTRATLIPAKGGNNQTT